MLNYVYVCGASKTGSTLLDMLLGGFSKAASLGEFSYFGKALARDQYCTCGASLKSCSMWDLVFKRVKNEMSIDLREECYALRQWDTQAAVNIDEEQQTSLYLLQAKIRTKYMKFNYRLPKKLRLPMPQYYKNGIKNTAYLYDCILEEWEKDFVVDSSKNIIKGLTLFENNPDKTKIILTVRDGRGSFNSNLSSGFTRESSLKDWLGYYSLVDKILLPNVQPRNLYIIKYEDLASDLEGSLKKLCAWLEIDFEPAMLDLTQGEKHMVEGNTTRFKPSKGVALDERWKQDLSNDDKKWFMDRAGYLNKRFGYS